MKRTAKELLYYYCTDFDCFDRPIGMLKKSNNLSSQKDFRWRLRVRVKIDCPNVEHGIDCDFYTYTYEERWVNVESRERKIIKTQSNREIINKRKGDGKYCISCGKHNNFFASNCSFCGNKILR